MVVVVTNYLDARGVRVADTVDMGCSARLADTLGIPLRCILCGPTMNSRTELPPDRVSYMNKTNHTDVRFHRRDSADGQTIRESTITERFGRRDWLIIIRMYVSSFKFKSLLARNKSTFLNVNFKARNIIL